MSADPQTASGTSSEYPPNTADRDVSVAPALTGTPDQDYSEARDWPSTASRLAHELTLQAARWITPDRLLPITLAIGLVLVTALTALSAKVYDAVTEADGIAGLDRPALDAMLTIRTSTGNQLVTAYTDLGGPIEMPLLAAIAAVTLALIWRQWTPILLTATTGLGSLLLTVVGKTFVGRSRPPLVDAVPPFETSFSFPSGHSLNALALAGIVAYLLVRQQRTLWARTATVGLASVFAVMMGLSRVYLGHHWLTDVLVAWSLALAWLAVVITAHRLFLTVHHRRSLSPGKAPADRAVGH